MSFEEFNLVVSIYCSKLLLKILLGFPIAIGLMICVFAFSEGFEKLESSNGLLEVDDEFLSMHGLSSFFLADVNVFSVSNILMPNYPLLAFKGLHL